MAVLRPYRGNGIGSQLLKAVIGEAAHQGHDRLFLHAQVSVIRFYEKHGFTTEGEVYVEAGIEHQTMVRKLNRE